MAMVSTVAARPGAAASARARFPALEMRSKGERPASTGVVRSVTSPQPTRIGVELSVIGSGGSIGKSNQDQGHQIGCEHGKQVHLRTGTWRPPVPRSITPFFTNLHPWYESFSPPSRSPQV